MSNMQIIENKTILITGGTGSFGQKFVEIVLRDYKPKRIIVFSRDELKQYEMQNKFRDRRLRFFIGDVRDRDRLNRAFEADVDVVVHASALKQVEACEYNPFEAVRTNVLGAQNVIDAAIDNGVPRTIAISTDKAVNPTNLYGATKLCAEKLFVQGNSYAGGKDIHFSCVRYGNVVGSRGSVIPKFLEQRPTGRVTVTDKRMTRFWITLEQGVEFVVNCLGIMHGGEIFIPRLPSTSTMDVAKAIAPDCDIEFTGIRPGEKLHESLISEDEARHAIRLDDIFVIQPEFHWWIADADTQGEPLPQGFTYESNNDEIRVPIEQLRKMVAEL